MKYSNELKVGGTLLVAALIFVLGVRYFEDLPLFKPTYDLNVVFDNAGGLIAGNVVRVNGVTIGSVSNVAISEETGKVEVAFHVRNTIPVTEGTYATIGGFDALGVVRMDLVLGPPTAPLIPENGYIEGRTGADVIGKVTARAPELLGQVDSVLVGLNRMLRTTTELVDNPGSDLRLTLAAMNGSVQALETILVQERDRVGRVMKHVESLTQDMDMAVGEDGERVAALMDGLDTTLSEVDATLADVRTMSSELTVVLTSLNNGEGTLGLMLKDPGLYHRMDSTLASLNSLLTDFQQDPGRYLKEMRIIDLF
ncbi:MAG: hypothetical protein COV99_02695 [Bacteroidetes bacterium CG12_big_fil_rev_8_21_14_0_65_60_17]|nr:MAG: hypothetical protein COV99_02695 [Bacteroidetes bacterium CG12_big_fil_rev_8_21_14_0_65_60_17]